MDLELHARYTPGASGGEASVFAVDQRIAAKTQVMEPFPEDRFLCSFSHIFAGELSESRGQAALRRQAVSGGGIPLLLRNLADAWRRAAVVVSRDHR